MSSSTTTSSGATTKFVRVPLWILRILDQTSVDLFLQYDNEPYVLYRDAGYPLSRDRVNGMAEQCEDALFVRASDYSKFGEDLIGVLGKVLDDEVLAPPERFEILQFAVSIEVEQALQMVSCEHYLAETRTIGRQITSLLTEEEVLPSDLFNIVRHDFRTFVHVTNVAGYTVLLAKELGIRQRNELEQIAIGALLHDIGKRHIPRSVLNKTAALTAADWEMIRQHPQRGYEELCQRPELLHGQLMMVYQHHEQICGEGYPVGITGKEIHPWAKMLTVVDVFDALTGERSYRRPATKQEATDFLASKAGTQFDEEIVRCWVSAMQEK